MSELRNGAFHVIQMPEGVMLEFISIHIVSSLRFSESRFPFLG